MQFLDITGVRLLKAYIDNKIPTKTSDLTNDSGFLGPDEEEVIATALNDLNDRVNTISSDLDVLDDFQLKEDARQKEKVTAAALNDLNTRVVNVEDFKTGFQNTNWVRAEDYSQIDTVVRDTYTKTQTDTLLSAKQDVLVSGTTLKTINNQSLLGSGNISISGGSGGGSGEENVIEAITFNGSSVPVTNKVAAITATLGDTNVIETVKVNGTALTPSSKAVDITVPTIIFRDW